MKIRDIVGTDEQIRALLSELCECGLQISEQSLVGQNPQLMAFMRQLLVRELASAYTLGVFHSPTGGTDFLRCGLSQLQHSYDYVRVVKVAAGIALQINMLGSNVADLDVSGTEGMELAENLGAVVVKYLWHNYNECTGADAVSFQDFCDVADTAASPTLTPPSATAVGAESRPCCECGAPLTGDGFCMECM